MRWLIGILLLLTTAPAVAAELSGLGGMVYDSDSAASNVAGQLEYRQALSGHIAASFTYFNEGHLPNHHRDGHGIQLWAGDTLMGRLSVAVGVGPYLYYDTATQQQSIRSANRHGLALLTSLAATWPLDDRLMLQLRVNDVATVASFNSVTTLVGVGYRFDTPSPAGTPPTAPQPTDKNELTLFLGETSVFSGGLAHVAAAALEYRRELCSYLEWSTTLLYEGRSDIINRGGLATQIGIRKSFLDDDLALAVGIGPYLAYDGFVEPGRSGTGFFLLPDLAMTAAYRLSHHWTARFSWHRISTGNDRDGEVWLAGIGYRF
jgi:hypothetical protein